MSEILVTGGLGFIGSELIRRAVGAGRDVVNVDLDTYAGDDRRLRDVEVRTEIVDVAGEELRSLLKRERARTVVHLAAETHVTRGETDPELFYRSNVEGTRNVLEAARDERVELVVHVSTDEVYGPALGRAFAESDKEPGEGKATSAYARSKAVADDLARSFADDLAVIVVRPTNCFGPWQHPEKAIARWTTRALRGEPLPVWGDGGYVRNWMHVSDACAGIETIVAAGVPGEIYNLGPHSPDRSNLEVARMIAMAAGRPADSVYLSAYDRPGHDRRYSVDSTKARGLGWGPAASLDERLIETVAWYRDNRWWWDPLLEPAEAIYEDARKA